MKFSTKLITISEATLLACSVLAPISTAFATTISTKATNSSQASNSGTNNLKVSKSDLQKNTQENKEDNSPLHIKSEDSTQPRKQYSAMGPGYYTQASIDLYNSIGRPNPFMMFFITPQQTAFLNRIKPTVLKAKSQGLLPSVMAAQAILESAWGTAAPGHNLFGIKWTGYGPYVYSGTQEYGAGGYYHTGARFRAYSSDEASMQDYINFFKQNPRYHNLFNQKDYHTVARLLKQDGYATDINYPSKIISTIEANGLAEWDKEASGSSVAPVGTIGEPEDIAQIKYVPNYGVLAFHSNGQSIPGSNSKFKDGTRWKVVHKVVINGQEMYDLGANQYIPKKYTDHYDNGVITIHYVPNYGVNALHANGTQILGSNSKFKTGSRWKITGTRMINGEICYEVGPDQFIPKKYTQWGKGQ